MAAGTMPTLRARQPGSEARLTSGVTPRRVRITVAYDGLNPIPPLFCYLKPYYNDPNDSYFVQLGKGGL